MRPSSPSPRRYVLVPSAGGGEPGDRSGGEPRGREHGRPRVRRYSLARVAVSPRSAAGVDWHRRLEDAADRGRA